MYKLDEDRRYGAKCEERDFLAVVLPMEPNIEDEDILAVAQPSEASTTTRSSG